MNLPCPGNAVGPITSANDPRVDVDGLTDLADRAHQNIVEKFVFDGGFRKKTLEDVFDALIEKDRPKAIELLVGLCMNDFLPNDQKTEVERDAGQVLHDFIEADDNLRDSMLEDMEEEDRREAMEGGDPRAAGWVA